MGALLLLPLFLSACAILVPVSTDSERCMVIYSMSQQDTIKIALKFPTDTRIDQFYDYSIKVKDLAGRVILHDKISSHIWRTEVTVPNQTIYEACIAIIANRTKLANTTVVYKGEVLVNYEANTHFLASSSKMPEKYEHIKEEEITTMRTQANDLINITRQFLELQKTQRQEERREYEAKMEVQQSLFEWWIVELLLIVVLGVVQWFRMKNRIEAKRD